jgi:hypothetical protein
MTSLKTTIVWWFSNIYGIYIISHRFLVGGAITILKNDGVRQWEG